MYCRNCGQAVPSSYIICDSCGVPLYGGADFCQECAAQTSAKDVKCKKCNCQLTPNMTQLRLNGPRSRTTAALLGFFLGSIGIHNFYLGFYKRGAIQLVLALAALLFVFTWFVSFAWSLIEAMVILNSKGPVDANGYPLRK